MPLYEYQCDSCGSVFEVRQKFADDPVTVHEDCGGSVRRLMSAPAFQFKGTGWYVTDYGKGGVKPGNGKSEKGESKPSEGKSEAKTESKSETKTDTKPESKPASGASNSNT